MAKYRETGSSGKLLMHERSRWTFFGLPFTFTTYTLTEKKLIVNSGLLTSTEDEILLYRIMDVTKRRTLFQKMFGLASLTISAQDKTSSTLVVKNIKNFDEFSDKLSEQVENDKMRLRVRRGEFVGSISDGDNDFDDGFDDSID